MHKNFLNFATAAVLGLGLSLSAVQAQDQAAGQPAERRHGGQMMDPEQQVQRLQQQLKLTDDQVGQIRPLLADAQKQAMDVRNDSTLAAPDRRAKMQSIHQDSLAKIKAVLTDDQKGQFDQMMEKQRIQMQQRRQERQNGSGDTSNQ